MQFDRLEWGVGGLLDGAVLGDIRVGMYGIGIPGIGTRGVYAGMSTRILPDTRKLFFSGKKSGFLIPETHPVC